MPNLRSKSAVNRTWCFLVLLQVKCQTGSQQSLSDKAELQSNNLSQHCFQYPSKTLLPPTECQGKLAFLDLQSIEKAYFGSDSMRMPSFLGLYATMNQVDPVLAKSANDSAHSIIWDYLSTGAYIKCPDGCQYGKTLHNLSLDNRPVGAAPGDMVYAFILAGSDKTTTQYADAKKTYLP